MRPPLHVMSRADIQANWPGTVLPLMGRVLDLGLLRITRLPLKHWTERKTAGSRRWEVEVFVSPFDVPSGDYFCVETINRGVACYYTLLGMFYEARTDRRVGELFGRDGFRRCWIVSEEEAKEITNG